MSLMRNLLNIIIIFCVCLNWACTEGVEERVTGETDYNTMQLSSLFPSPPSCVLSPKVSNTKSSLRVVHRHGPCSGKSTTNTDHDDILKRDQARVDFIHSKLSKKLTDRYRTSQTLDLPVKEYGDPSSGTYSVTIGMGTPKHDVSLLFDTGSDLTWTKCEACGETCSSQAEPKFNPISSTSYSNVSCSSPVCGSLVSAGIKRNCSPPNCMYTINYGDGSWSSGFLSKEKFTLTSSDVFDGISFGCCKQTDGDFSGVDGLLGLGRSSLSFPSQTAKIYNKIFSYCLPSPSYTGHLTFGSVGISNSVKFTPASYSRDQSFYGLNMEGISVGGQKLKIPLTVFSSPGAIIDSGTVITRLPPKAYAALRNAFKKQMLKLNHTTSSPHSDVLDTCYDFTGFERTVKSPKISFYFRGGAVVELGSNGVFYPIAKSQFCLAFAGNDDESNSAIFGSVQQQTLQVVYDGVGNRVGFAPNGCS